MTDKLAVSNQSSALNVQTMEDLSRLSNMLAQSKFFQDAKDAAQAGVKVLAGKELGFPAIASMTGIHIVKGKVSIGSNLIAAAIKRSNRYDYRVKTLTPSMCEIVFFENGESVGSESLTMEEATQRKLNQGKDTWKNHPKNMLFARCISNGAKFYCPDLFIGTPIYTPDEFDIDEETGRPVQAVEVEVLANPDPSSQQPQQQNEDSKALATPAQSQPGQQRAKTQSVNSANGQADRFKELATTLGYAKKDVPAMFKFCAGKLKIEKKSDQLTHQEERAIAHELFVEWAVGLGAFNSAGVAHQELLNLIERGGNPTTKDVCAGWKTEINQRLEEINQQEATAA